MFLAHPGGPFWAGRDGGAWTIPKGVVEAGEDVLDAAKRELARRPGITPGPPFIPLGFDQAEGGKDGERLGVGRRRRPAHDHEQHDEDRVAPRIRRVDDVIPRSIGARGSTRHRPAKDQSAQAELLTRLVAITEPADASARFQRPVTLSGTDVQRDRLRPVFHL